MKKKKENQKTSQPVVPNAEEIPGDRKTSVLVNTVDTGEDNGSAGKVKRKRGTTFERKLFAIETAVNNSLNDPLILQYVQNYGYDENRLIEGQQLAKEAREKYEVQKRMIAAKLEKYRFFKTKKEEADASYRHFVKIIRLGFDGVDSVIDTLGFSTGRGKGFGDWIAKLGIFYTNIFEMSDVMEFMAKLDLSREQLEAGQTMLKDAAKANNEIKNAKAESEKATELKNKTFSSLWKWWQNYKKIVLIALEVDPQLKEKLGITTP